MSIFKKFIKKTEKAVVTEKEEIREKSDQIYSDVEMKEEILNRLVALGGTFTKGRDKTLISGLLDVTFDTVFYPKPEDTPWSKADETEPIYGVSEFIKENHGLYRENKSEFYDKMIKYYFCLTEGGQGQDFWEGTLFTPFKKKTADHGEWIDWFETEADLSIITQLTKDEKPDFIRLFHGCGFPDQYYICLSDPNLNDPTVFGTDHEEFFVEISNHGKLSDFLNRYMDQNELINLVEMMMEKFEG